MSSICSYNGNFEITKLIENKVFFDIKEVESIFPNYDLKFVNGFINVFKHPKKP